MSPISTNGYKLRLSVWLRNARVDEQGCCSLSLRLTISGERGEYQTGIRVPVAYWPKGAKEIRLPADKTQRLPHMTAQWVAEANAELAALKGKAKDCYYALPSAQRSAKRVRAFLRGGPEALEQRLSPSLLTLGELFYAWATGVTSDREPSTLSNYRSRLRTIERFLVESEKNKQLKAIDVAMPLARRFERWCLQDGGHSPASMRKQVNMLQMVVAHGAAEGFIPANTLHGYKYQSATPVIVPKYLPEAELARLREARYAEPQYYKAVDAFLFCCYTGLSWVDYLLFDPVQHLQTDEEGAVWLHMVRQKMRKRKPEGFWTPILPEAQELLTRYRGQDGVVRLPKLHNSYANRVLKQVTEALHLSLPLTCKLARATFAQRMCDRGVARHIVAAMMGDTERVVEKHYSRERLTSIAAEVRSKFGTTAPVDVNALRGQRPVEEMGRVIQFRFGV